MQVGETTTATVVRWTPQVRFVAFTTESLTVQPVLYAPSRVLNAIQEMALSPPVTWLTTRLVGRGQTIDSLFDVVWSPQARFVSQATEWETSPSVGGTKNVAISGVEVEDGSPDLTPVREIVLAGPAERGLERIELPERLRPSAKSGAASSRS